MAPYRNTDSPYLEKPRLSPEELERYHAMSGFGTQAATGALQAPSGYQTPQTGPAAPVASPESNSGIGGFGGFLQALFSPQGSRQQRTKELLLGEGLDEGTATLLANDKPSLQAYLRQRAFPDKVKRDTTVVDGKLIDAQTGQVIGDYGDSEQQPLINAGEGRLYDPNNGQWIQAPDSGQPDPKIAADTRKEIVAMPSYKAYTAAVPVYNAAVDAAGRNSKAADLDLIYAFGKLMDPGSVVREGEMVMVQGTGSFQDRVRSWLSEVDSTGRLNPQVRSELMAEMQGRMQAYRGQFDAELGPVRKWVDDNQYNPEHILPPLPEVKAWTPAPAMPTADRFGEGAMQPTPGTNGRVGAPTIRRFNPATGRLE